MMKRHVKAQHGMQGVFIFVLLGLFALMSTLIVLLGAQMYRTTVDKSDQNNTWRILSAYVRSMVRAEDSAENVSVETMDGVRALALRERIEDEDYITWIYAYDGSLYEQFTHADNEFEPEGGVAICPVGAFDADIDGELVTVNMETADGEPVNVQVALRCGA